MNNLHFLSYNNYNNRQILIPDVSENIGQQLSEYLSYEVLACNNINFNPGNGLVTEQVINSGIVLSENFSPNYLLVTNLENRQISSRWFVMKTDRNLSGQYKLLLKRDVIADNFNEVLSSKCFVERGTLGYDDPFIYNDEGLAFNQIKQSETLLKDYTSVPWIVGYIPRELTGNKDFTASLYYDDEYDDISDYPFFQYANKTLMPLTDNAAEICVPTYINNIGMFAIKEARGVIALKLNTKQVSYDAKKISEINIGPTSTYYTTEGGDRCTLADNFNSFEDRVVTRMHSVEPLTQTQIKQAFTQPDVCFTSDYNSLILHENGKIIKTNGGYYKVTINTQSEVLSPAQTISNVAVYTNSILMNMHLDNTKQRVAGVGYSNELDCNFKIPYTYPCYLKIISGGYTFKIDYMQGLPEEKLTFNFNNNRKHVADCPFDMFCMPYGDLQAISINLDKSYSFSKQSSINISTGLASLGQGVIYDLQLLPYCPIRNFDFIDLDCTQINLDSLNCSNGTPYSVLTSTVDNREVGIVFWAGISSFTFNIQYDLDCPTTAKDLKKGCQTDFARLCSPNYNGLFQFNPYKNKVFGTTKAISFINVDCTYKPYSPYIHLNPNFGGLYGEDFNDARGLICNGDFSLTTITDRWAEYEIQNKNYQNMYNREVSNMEVKHNLNEIQTVVNTATSMVGQAANKNPIGMATNFVNTAAKLAIQEFSHREDLDFKSDMFNYQLDNIKALPDALTKVSALNENNKLFPFIELYSCTDEEKETLDEYITYKGMKVGRIDTLRNYYKLLEPRYIQAKIIRLPSANMNAEMATEISKELAMGLYI